MASNGCSTYEVGQRVYWRSMGGDLLAGIVRARGLDIAAQEYAYFVYQDGSVYGMWMHGPFFTMPASWELPA